MGGRKGPLIKETQTFWKANCKPLDLALMRNLRDIVLVFVELVHVLQHLVVQTFDVPQLLLANFPPLDGRLRSDGRFRPDLLRLLLGREGDLWQDCRLHCLLLATLVLLLILTKNSV